MNAARSTGLGLTILALAAALRLAQLGAWSLDGDEIYSWYDVQDVLAGEAWPPGAQAAPGGYLLIGAFVAALGLDESSVRLGPALCGLGAVAALWWLRRRERSVAERLATTLLAALSPWLVYHAQTARFYGPLLLCASLATLWSLPGPGRRPLRAGLAWLGAVACHPTGALLAPGLLAPLLLERRGRLRLAGLGVLGAGALVLLVQPGAPFHEALERALAGVDPGRYDALRFVLGLGYNVGPMTGLLAAVGLFGLRRAVPAERLLLCGAALLPPAVLLAAGLSGISVHQRYVMAAVPAVLLLAGRGLAATWARSTALGALATVLAVLACLPGLVAHHSDGNRHDIRGVARELAARAAPDDIFVIDEHATVELYLHERPGFSDIETVEAPLVEPHKLHGFLRNRRECWLALKRSRMAGAYGEEFLTWVQDYFDEITNVGVAPGPLVRHDNRYVILKRRTRLPPSPFPEPGEPTESPPR